MRGPGRQGGRTSQVFERAYGFEFMNSTFRFAGSLLKCFFENPQPTLFGCEGGKGGASDRQGLLEVLQPISYGGAFVKAGSGVCA